MQITRMGKKKFSLFRARAESYLEIKVRDDASAAEVDAIVQALATISSFFGTRLDTGHGGSGGGSQKLARSKRGFLGSLLPTSNTNILPPKPDIGPESHIGGKL